MRADYLTYRRATSESVRGLVLQAVLGVAMLIYGLWARDAAATAAAAFIGIGCLAWLTLAIVYDQHRRERIESIEAEALANAPTAGTSVFEKQDEFLPAARRLAALYKFFVPIMSIVIGSLLVGAGIWMFLAGREQVTAVVAGGLIPDHTVPGREGWAMGIGLVVAGLGFVFARFTAGMSKQKVYSNLRAGSSYAVGAALLGLTLAIAKFVQIIGPDVMARYLKVVFPAFMVVIGVEVFINFVLALYRPRRAGEAPRAAFDSRLLSLVAAPDKIAQSINEAINYQLGFDVTSGWFYKLLSRWALPLLILGIVIVWALSSVVIVQPHQRAMVLRFGQPVQGQEDLGPGAHFKAPWPIDKVYIPEYFSRDEGGRVRVTDRTATGLRVLDLGSAPSANKDAILWTNDHAGEEVFQYVRAASYDQSADLADLAIVSVEIPLHYVVSDVKLFDELAPPDKRDDLLKAIAQRELTFYFQRTVIDDLLGSKRDQISRELRQRVQEAFNKLNPDPADPKAKPRGAGVQVVFLGIVGVHPPKQVAAAFEGPVMADQRREANIDDARAYAIEKLAQNVGNVALARTIIAEIDTFEKMNQANAEPKALEEQELKIQGLIETAGGGAAKALAEARADRWKAHMGTRSMAARHQGQLALYAAAPEYYRASRYFEALKAAMESSRVYITSDDLPNTRFDVDLKSKDLGVDIFAKPAQ